MTGADLVKASLRLIGVIASGESPSTEEAADGIAALNRMLGGWNESLQLALAGSLASTLYTFVALPVNITDATVISQSVGWQKAMIYSLACDLAPEFGRPLPVEVAATAQTAKAAVMKLPTPTVAQ